MRRYVLLIVFLVLLAFVMLLHITKDTPFDSIYEKNVIGNATNNISNRGKVAVQGDWVYYYNADSNFLNPEGLYRIRKDNSGLALMDTGSISFINVVGDWVYYVKHTTAGKRITYSYLYKIKLDGSCKKKIADNASYVHVVDNKIYYSVSVDVLGGMDGIELNFPIDDIGNIYQCDLDGKECIKIASRKDGGFLHILNDYVYYNVGKHCYRMNLFDKKTEYVTDVAWHVIVSDDAIYYVSYDESTIFKYDIVQQTTSEIAKNVERVNYMIVINDKLYYRNGIGNSLQVLDLYTLETDELFISGDIYSFDNEPYVFYNNKLEKLDLEF